MNGKKQAKQAKEENRFDFGATLALGISLGLVAGAALGNPVLGITGGLLLATLANAYQERKQGRKGATTALAITLLAMLLLILLTVPASG